MGAYLRELLIGNQKYDNADVDHVLQATQTERGAGQDMNNEKIL